MSISLHVKLLFAVLVRLSGLIYTITQVTMSGVHHEWTFCTGLVFENFYISNIIR